MKNKIKVLVMLMVLSLPLSACNESGEKPKEDNQTVEVEDNDEVNASIAEIEEYIKDIVDDIYQGNEFGVEVKENGDKFNAHIKLDAKTDELLGYQESGLAVYKFLDKMKKDNKELYENISEYNLELYNRSKKTYTANINTSSEVDEITLKSSSDDELHIIKRTDIALLEEQVSYKNIIDEKIPFYLKYGNYNINISGDKPYELEINLDPDDKRLEDKFAAAKEVFEFIESIKDDESEVEEDIKSYKINYFVDGEKVYVSEVDNYPGEKLKKIELITLDNNEIFIVEDKDIEEFYKEEERKKIAEEEKKAAEKKKAEEKRKEEERKKKEAEKAEKERLEKEEREKYNTGITVKDMARDKDGLIGSYVKFSGKILQVMQGSGYNQYRMAVNDDYKQVILLEIDEYLLDKNILEDDYITIYRMSIGNISYTTVMGAENTIPGIIVDKFNFK